MDDYVVYYRLEFDFDTLELVDKILNDKFIIKKIFQSSCEYVIKLNELTEEKILALLYERTFHLVKITKITSTLDEIAEVGTDKPIGSKSAIDEN